MLATFIALVAANLVVSVAVSKKPLVFARFAVIPVGEKTTLPLTARVGALVVPLREGTATYRDAPSRELRLAALPGEPIVKGDHHVLHFVPESSCVVAQPRQWNANLVRVDVSGTPAGLVLSGRRIPTEMGWAVLLTVVVWHWEGPLRSHLHALSFMLVFVVFSLIGIRRRASDGFEGVVEEVTRRVASANGDAPPPEKEQVVMPVVNADEWLCACGKVNELRRTTCGRCWAQRADVQT